MKVTVMQDIKVLREDFDGLKAALLKRGKDYQLEKFVEMDKRRKELIAKSETLKAQQNATSKQIPIMKKEGKDTAELMAEMKELAETIKSLEPELRDVEYELDNFLMRIPNAPHESVPAGLNENEDRKSVV